MKHKKITALFIAACVLGSITQSVHAAQHLVTVTITNLTHGIYFTPFLVSAHDDTTHIFEGGTTATANLQAMAEGGDISGLSADLGGADLDTIENPAGGLLGPGESATANLDTTLTGNSYLSIVSMLLPTNDAFVGLDALKIPPAGTYTYYLNAYDAGTEANDELITGGGAPGVPGIPMAPGGDGGSGGTGVTSTDTNTTVHIHRGNLGDTDPNGDVSDVDSTIHRWLNPVVKLVLTVQ